MRYFLILLLVFLTSCAHLPCAYLQCVDTARKASEKMVADAKEINAIKFLYSIKILEYGCKDNTPWILCEVNDRRRVIELDWYKYWYENKKIIIVPQEE